MIETIIDEKITPKLLQNYFKSLVNRFFKILPIRECGDSSLPVYIRSLQIELIGCKNFIPYLESEASFLTLLSILQFFIDNPDSDVKDVKREVFRAINICNRLKLLAIETEALGHE